MATATLKGGKQWHFIPKALYSAEGETMERDWLWQGREQLDSDRKRRRIAVESNSPAS